MNENTTTTDFYRLDAFPVIKALKEYDKIFKAKLANTFILYFLSPLWQ